MAGKRRSTRQQASRSPKKQAKTESDEPEKSAEDGPKVSELFEQCFNVTAESERKRNIRQWGERGSLEKHIWPCMKETSDDAEFLQGCQLVALLVADRCWEGSFFGSTMLTFITEEETAKKMFDALFYKTDAKNVELQATIAHFAVVVLGSDNKVLQKTLMEHLAGVQLWHHMPDHRRELEIKKSPGIRRKLESTKKGDIWLVNVVRMMMTILEKTISDEASESEEEPSKDNEPSKVESQFLHRSLELLIDLLTTFPTRKYLVAYLDSIHFSICAERASQQETNLSQNNRLVKQLLERIDQLLAFPIQEYGQDHMSKFQVVSQHHSRAIILQKLSQRHFPHALQEVVYAGVSLLCAQQQGNDSFLKRSLASLSTEHFEDLLGRMRLIERGSELTWDHMLQVLSHYLSIPSYPVDKLKSSPLYPTEAILWDHNVIPPSNKAIRLNSVLSVPKLDRQFLSYQDYLLRNFELIRLESAYEIRADMVQVIQRMRPVLREAPSADLEETSTITEFGGWSRMAIEMDKRLQIVDVQPPKVGENVSSLVVAEFGVDLKLFGESIRREWEELGEFDNLFLIGVDASKMNGQPQSSLNEFYAENGVDPPIRAKHGEKKVPDEEDSTFPARMGVQLVRGCMILEVRDDDGKVLSDPTERGEQRSKSTKRMFKVALDPAQYDMDRKLPGGTDIYRTINLIMRRDGRENNFKSMLECIRGLMEGSGSIDRVLPEWLHRLFLGQDDPAAALYSSDKMKQYASKTVGVNKQTEFMNFRDTFVDKDHLKESFTEKVTIVADTEGPKAADVSRLHYQIRVDEAKGNAIKAKPTPYAAGAAAGNSVRFTPSQVEAIRSGLSPGLTLCVGPPGTGKTDVAVQIIACLFHSYPTQRTVIITHSNAALNDIFDKVMARGDIDERFLLRLGSGEKDLQTKSTHDFTKIGRVAFSLKRRDGLLDKVQLLAESLGVISKAARGKKGVSAYTCESAEYFHRQHIEKKIRQFQHAVTGLKEDDAVTAPFPFEQYCNLNDKSLTKAEALHLLSEIAGLFKELVEYRPYELLRSQRQRSNFLILKQARIVAMTCTHAAIARSQLVELGFEYDNIIMEESAQMTEIEAFIPMLLQSGESDQGVAGKSRLKRICMLGDHHQLPPVIKNACLAKYSNLDQSLFTRLIRNGVPYIQLDKQGRARPSLASLYSWRYKDLGNLSHVLEREDYQQANTGLAHAFQMINVEDFDGRGESTPTAYFYQNVGEAEYAVALFQYMILIGYPAEKIAILTTYKGQKGLINDVLSQRCGPGTPFAGLRPRSVSTVDQYQGQQNDFILLSLVRTSSVGHLRDIRRLVVAVSRARLGLYVFCRSGVFSGCHELRKTFDQLSSKPTKLQLVLGENYPTSRKVDGKIPKDKLFDVEDVAQLGSIVHSMQQDWMDDSSK